MTFSTTYSHEALPLYGLCHNISYFSRVGICCIALHSFLLKQKEWIGAICSLTLHKKSNWEQLAPFLFIITINVLIVLFALNALSIFFNFSKIFKNQERIKNFWFTPCSPRWVLLLGVDWTKIWASTLSIFHSFALHSFLLFCSSLFFAQTKRATENEN